jgi:AhpD family alkylhydroperoxidase
MTTKTNIPLVHQDHATEEVQQLYDKLQAMIGRIGPVFRAMAHKPEYLKLVVEKFELLMAETRFNLRTKLLVYLTVSIMNNCSACISAFTGRLKTLGLTDEEFVELYSVIDLASGMNHTANAIGNTAELARRAIKGEKDMNNIFHISQVLPDQATEEVQQLYDRNIAIMGRDLLLPFYQAMANMPEYLKLLLDKFELFMGETKLEMKNKLLVYLTVSIMNNCTGCIYAFTGRLKTFGLTDEEFVELYSVIDTASGMNTVAIAIGNTPELMEDYPVED